nr:ankyrin repeat domain containing protein [Mimivirus sp.]
MNLIDNTNNPIITLKTLNGDIQTKHSTIEYCTGLLELLDKNTNIITINHSHYFVDNLLNYLRGNGDEKYLLKYAYDLKNLGIEMTKENYVFINIGGKIIYISKILLTTYFEYFEIFFENYAQYDPDYSKILIDKSSILFDEIIRNLSSDLNKNIQFQREISFYGPKKSKNFLIWKI